MEPSHRPPQRNYSLISYILAALVGTLLGVIVMVTVRPEMFNSLLLWSTADAEHPEAPVVERPVPPVVQPVPLPVSSLQNDGISQSRRTAVVSAVERVSPTVVSIVATQIVRQRGYARLFDDPFFGGVMVPRIYRREVPNTGSGVIFTSDGYIVTNAHVVQHAQRIRVVLTDGRALESDVVGIDAISDLAVLKVEADNLVEAKLGVSADAMVGEWAIAIGNPLGLAVEDAQPAVTIGVVSAVGRDFPRSGSESSTVYRNMIQTDASINPGNSGGPLVNALGEVIGINAFILSENGGSVGIGFAIPIDHVNKVVSELIKFGKPRSGWIGLYVTDITRFLAEELNVEDRNGVLVNEVAGRSPAQLAGVQVGDVIREVNGTPVANRAEAAELLYGHLVGDTVDFIIERNGKRIEISLQIEEGQD
ncbi:MAG: trypsin-like peptidase domain-containing protein [Gemmatimonadota bacterium]|nr:trypsin-like peptidase domain-containing protein [Gemmatimonadota bacterium]